MFCQTTPITSVADVNVTNTTTSISLANENNPIVLQPTTPNIEAGSAEQVCTMRLS